MSYQYLIPIPFVVGTHWNHILLDTHLHNNKVANGEITHDEQFLLLPHCLQLYFHIFFCKLSKSSSADLLYVGNGYEIREVFCNNTIYPFPYKYAFDISAADGFLKTCQQKKKLLKTSNFSPCFHIYSIIVLSFKGIFCAIACAF